MSPVESLSEIESCKIIGENVKYGAIVKCKDVYHEDVFVSLQEYKSGRNRIHMFTKKCEVVYDKAKECSRMIHRGNLALDGNELSDAGKQKVAMIKAGYKVAAYPREEFVRRRLFARGYRPYIERNGEFVMHDLGLVYALPKE